MKGDVQDVLWVFILMFVVGIFLLFMTVVAFRIDTLWSGMSISPEAKDIVHNTIYPVYDEIWAMFPIIFFGLYFVALILAFNVGSHPIFAWISLILLFIDTIVTSVLGFAYNSISNSPDFITTIARYPVVDFIFQNYAFLFAVMGIGMFIVLYHRGGGSGK